GDGEVFAPHCLGGPLLCEIHFTTGRLRVLSPLVQGSEVKAEEAIRLLSRVEGVTDVETRSLTGSVIIHFDPQQVGPDVLLHALMLHGFIFPMSHRVPRRPKLTLHSIASE